MGCSKEGDGRGSSFLGAYVGVWESDLEQEGAQGRRCLVGSGPWEPEEPDLAAMPREECTAGTPAWV